MISLCAEFIVRKIVHDCQNANYLGIIADEATDKAPTEQLYVCLRFVDESGNNPVVREECVGFVQADSVNI